jgi:FixJ family two-component response regulator
MLDVYFQQNPYPDPRETEEISNDLNLPESVIKVWFQNKRSRDKQRKFSNRSRSRLLLAIKNENSFSSPVVCTNNTTNNNIATQLNTFQSKVNTFNAAAMLQQLYNNTIYQQQQRSNFVSMNQNY